MSDSKPYTAQEISASLEGYDDQVEGFGARFMRFMDDGRIMRVAFSAMLIGVGATLYLDYTALSEADSLNSIQPGMANPILPPVIRERERVTQSPSVDDSSISDQNLPSLRKSFRPAISVPQERLREPLKVTLGANGTLLVEGTIHVGAFEIFALEIESRGEYIKRIELVSPGGSVQDALAMSQLIRERGYSTFVRAGSLCASSCPIVFAGGKERIAEEGAAIGVHQIYAPEESYANTNQAIYSTQAITAEINRWLSDMGVDPIVWTYALETPPQQLYYFTMEEMVEFKLVAPMDVATESADAKKETDKG